VIAPKGDNRRYTDFRAFDYGIDSRIAVRDGPHIRFERIERIEV